MNIFWVLPYEDFMDIFGGHRKEHLAIRRIFSLVDIITNNKFSNCPNVFEIGVV